jgi:hypothetical protein
MDQYRTYSAKHYFETVKNNEQKHEEEKERIRTFCKTKYQNDEEYKQYKRKQALDNYYKRKERANAVAVN